MKPFILITGTGSSGSTWAAALFAALGFDAGDAIQGQPRGNEWGPLMPFIQGIHSHYNLVQEWTQDKEDEVVEQMKNFTTQGKEWPEVVKIPHMGVYLDCWIRAGQPKPTEVVLCMREPEAILKSAGAARNINEPNQLRQHIRANWAETLWACVKHGIPIACLTYPQVGDGPYCFGVLYKLLQKYNKIDLGKFLEAHQETFRPDWQHYG